MRAAAALLALLLAVGQASARQPVPLTYDELRTLPDDALNQRLFGSVAPDIVLSPRPRERTAFLMRPVEIWAWTRPRPSSQPGLCETDRSILVFQPAIPGIDRQNPVLRLARIVTQTYYIVHDRALAEGRTRRDPENRNAWAAGCADRDPRRDGVPADDPGQLLRARTLIGDLGTAARAGRSPAPLDCTHRYWNRAQPADEAACLREITWLRPDLMGWVSQCRGVPAAANCVRVLASEMFIEFSLNLGQQAIAIRIEEVEDTSAIE
jgi:hypothetical protein